MPADETVGATPLDLDGEAAAFSAGASSPQADACEDALQQSCPVGANLVGSVEPSAAPLAAEGPGAMAEVQAASCLGAGFSDPSILPLQPRQRFQPPRVMDMPEFQLEDAGGWLQHLHANGVVRIREVLSGEEAANAKRLFWHWLEGLGGDARRDDPSTWTDANFPGLLDKGFFCTRGGGQSAAAWAVRGNRRVHQAFAQIWETEELIASFDTFIGWRPWWPVAGAAAATRPRTEGIHCDQNPHTKRGLHCIQGMVPLRPVTKRVGGLCVAPGTHGENVQDRLRQLFPHTVSDDWLPLERKFPDEELTLCGELVEAAPGDLILWDSRALHGGYVGPGDKDASEAEGPELARLSLAVCMVPAAGASAKDLERRVTAVEKGHTMTHWPLGFKKQAGKDSAGTALSALAAWQAGYSPPPLDDWCMALVRGRAAA
mmetsp:Transcript_133771/g.333873  ORF Transcript_133771/g.333873 Transcript_133771/m.333873 type:complete len:431 (-) Transcript_133771:9-1301(-)